jgi:hypothetical protein
MHNKRLKLDVIFNGDRRRLKYFEFRYVTNVANVW